MSLLTFTGNPLIDNGNAVIAAFCGKSSLYDITKDDILQNIDSFLEIIQDHFHNSNATDKELEFAKRGLKQHFALLYTTNHYLFGINNKIHNPVTGKKETVQTGKDFVYTFKQEVIGILENSNKLLKDKERQSKDNICKFCGRSSDIIITKDIVPLATGLTQKNLGQVHCCNLCYLPILFCFVTMINVRSSENSKGIYMFYHFSNEQYMIEYARQQLEELKYNTMSSLKTMIGPQYEVLVRDLISRLKRFKRKIKSMNDSQSGYVTAYFLLNDNRGASFNYINVPDGMCTFLIKIDNIENIWGRIKQNLYTRENYEKLFTGAFYCIRYDGIPKPGFEEMETVMLYLKEVNRVDDKLIEASQNIARGLVKYYKSISKSWVEEYDRKMNHQKSYDFINGLLDMNEAYFKTHGDNIFSVTDVKQAVGNHGMAFRLVKYFTYNSMEEEERNLFVSINRKRENIREEESEDEDGRD